MELSLEFLIENLALSKENYQKKSSGRKYRCLCLDTAPGILSDGSLIVTNSLPKEENCPKNTGFLFVNLTQPVPEHVSYEYVHINSPVDYHSFFNQVLAIFQSTKEKIENLYRLSVRNASLQTLIEEAGELFDNPLYLVDSSFKAIAIDRRKNMRELSATWKRLEDDGYMPLDLVANLIQSQELNTMENEPAAAVIHSDFFYTPFINCNLRYKGQIQGHLFVVGMFRTIKESDLEIAEAVSEIVLQTLLRNVEFQNQHGRFYRHFMKDLLEGKTFEKSYFERQIKYLNLPEACCFLLGIFQCTQKEEAIYERLASQMEYYTQVRLVPYRDSLVCLFLLKNKEQQKALMSRLKKILKSFHCTGGFSDVFSSIKEAPVYVKQARRALSLRNYTSREDICFFYKDLALYDLLEKGETEKKIFCSAEILDILEYDRLHGTPYIETLRIYLLYERNILQSAAALPIHRNPLTYRLDKMQDIFRLDLETPHIRCRYLLSLLIL